MSRPSTRRSSASSSSGRASTRTSTTRRGGVQPDRLRHPDLHAAVRRGAGVGLDGAHHGAGGIQRLIRPLSAYTGHDERHIDGFVDEVGTSAIALRAAEAEG
jgi:hypothetical protein